MCSNNTCKNPVINGCGNWQPPVPLAKVQYDIAIKFCMEALKNPSLVQWNGEGECPFCEFACSGAYDEVLLELCARLDKLIDCPLCGSDYDLSRD